jgi:hypothetical protein
VIVRRWFHAALVASLLGASACSRDTSTRPPAASGPALMDPWPTLPDVLALRALLRDNNFAGLDSAYRVLADSHDTSFRAERRFARALSAFEIDDARVSEQLAAWTRAAADARPAHAVRFDHLIYRAFAARGEDFARATDPARLQAFHGLVREAAVEAQTLLQADSNYLPAYWSALELARLGGDSTTTIAVLKRALAVAPASYQTRMEGIWALSPRWGGSLGAMWGVANGARADSALNPLFPALRTFPFIEMAQLSLLAGDTASALSFADSAVDVAREPLACITRAEFELIVLLGDAARQDYTCASRLISLRASRVASRAVAEADVAWQRSQAKGTPAFVAALALSDSALMLDPADSMARTVSRRLKELN